MRPPSQSHVVFGRLLKVSISQAWPEADTRHHEIPFSHGTVNLVPNMVIRVSLEDFIAKRAGFCMNGSSQIVRAPML